MIRVIADRGTCISAGNCVQAAPAIFDQSHEDGLVQVIVELVDGKECDAAYEAAEARPSGAIRLVDDGGSPTGV